MGGVLMTANNLTLKKSLITASKRLLRTAAPSCLAVKQIPSCLAFMVFVLRPKCVCAQKRLAREREGGRWCVADDYTANKTAALWKAVCQTHVRWRRNYLPKVEARFIAERAWKISPAPPGVPDCLPDNVRASYRSFWSPYSTTSLCAIYKPTLATAWDFVQVAAQRA